MDTICHIEVQVPSAGTLMLDLLVAHGDALSADVLCRSGALFGLSDTSIRVALTRLVTTGKVVRPRRGFYAIDRAAGRLPQVVEDWQGRQERAGVWRHHWLAIEDAGVARADKTAWRRHGLARSLRGFAPLRPTLHVRPDNLRGGLAAERAQLAALGLSSQALVFRLAGLDGSGHAEAAALWDVRRLAHDHRRLRTALQCSARALGRQKPEQALRESLLLGRTVIGHLLRDPVLPPELMSPATREALVRETGAYQVRALRLWRRWFAAAPGGAD